MEKPKLRELFFEEFVKSLIMHSAPQPTEAEIEPMMLSPLIREEITLGQPISAVPQAQRVFPQAPILPIPIYRTQTAPLPMTQQLGIESLSKLNFLIADPSVFSIECPGPSKIILVNKQGRTQATNIILSKEEIDKIISEFSEKTHIPLIQGTFKAVSGRLLMTAVISEFVGTRFIIQKRVPAY
jgi:hypothetical protein